MLATPGAEFSVLALGLSGTILLSPQCLSPSRSPPAVGMASRFSGGLPPAGAGGLWELSPEVSVGSSDLSFSLVSGCVSFGPASCSSLSLFNASKMPFHASRSIRSSCSPRFCFCWSELVPASALAAAGIPTPSDGGTKLGAGALIADGAMREYVIWARELRMALWMDCKKISSLGPT